MKTQIVQIGNSKGIRIPKILLEECGFDETTPVEVIAKNHKIIIQSAFSPRADWEEKFKKNAKVKNEEFSDVKNLKNEWDETEWEW